MIIFIIPLKYKIIEFYFSNLKILLLLILDFKVLID